MHRDAYRSPLSVSDNHTVEAKEPTVMVKVIPLFTNQAESLDKDFELGRILLKTQPTELTPTVFGLL